MSRSRKPPSRREAVSCTSQCLRAPVRVGGRTYGGRTPRRTCRSSPVKAAHLAYSYFVCIRGAKSTRVYIAYSLALGRGALSRISAAVKPYFS